MTSASELFYQRRSRVSRANSDLGLEPSLSDRSFYQNYNRRHHHNHNHNHRHDLDGCDPLRRPPHVRTPCHRLSSQSERASARLDQGTDQFVPSNNLTAETLSRPRVTGNGRLPGAVLLARARLLERLRGVSLSVNRRSGPASFGIYNREYTLGDELRVVDAGAWGTDISTGLFAGVSPFNDSTFQTERPHTVQESCKRKPPGLTQDALQCLQSEVFSCLGKGIEGGSSQVSRDCSICLESFSEGDELIRLPCDHRFHSACLDPWVRTCGDCPYCRRDIVGFLFGGNSSFEVLGHQANTPYKDTLMPVIFKLPLPLKIPGSTTQVLIILVRIEMACSSFLLGPPEIHRCPHPPPPSQPPKKHHFLQNH